MDTQITEIINGRREGDFAYIAFFKQKSVTLYAKTLYDAKLIAEEHFKPYKKDRGLLSVYLIQKPDGEEVVHTLDQ